MDAADFALMRQLFSTTSAQADLDGDGDVDAVDFSMFRQFYGTTL